MGGALGAWLGIVGVGLGASLTLIQQRLLLVSKRREDQELMWQSERRAAYTSFLAAEEACYRAVDVQDEGSRIEVLRDPTARTQALVAMDAVFLSLQTLRLLTSDRSILDAAEAMKSAVGSQYRMAVGKPVERVNSSNPDEVATAFQRAEVDRVRAVADFVRNAGRSLKPELTGLTIQKSL